jgi:mannose-6-phosphate isomerase-like protein (cupin superfamily)
MPVYNGWEFPNVKVDPPTVRYLKLIASPDTNGYNNASVFFSHIPVGGTTGMHTHANNDEIMYFTGRGICIENGKESELQTDSVVIAPKGVPHECRNTSETETLKLFCVFLPALEAKGQVMQMLVEKTKAFLKGKGLI